MSLNRNVSTLPYPEALFSCITHHLGFCKLKEGIFFVLNRSGEKCIFHSAAKNTL